MRTSRQALVLASFGALVIPAGVTAPNDAIAADPRTRETAPAAPLSGCFPTDNGDPRLTSLSVTPSTLDLRQGPKVIRFGVTAADSGGPGAASGVRQVRVFYENPTGLGYDATMRATANGTWTERATLPTGVRSGTWSVTGLTVTDAVGHSKAYDRSAVAALGPSTFTVSGPHDLRPPELLSLTVSASRVDTRRHAKNVQFRVRARDDLSGVTAVRVEVRDHRFGEGQTVFLRHRVRLGGWVGTLRVPRWHSVAHRRLWVELDDRTRRTATVGPRMLAGRGLPHRLLVLSSTDRDSPTVVRAVVRPTDPDVRQVGRTLHVDVRARDATSGVRAVRVLFTSASEQATDLSVELHRVSGTGHDGLWRGAVRLSRCTSPPSVWSGDLFVQDRSRRSNQQQVTVQFRLRALDHSPPHLGDPVITGGRFRVEFEEDVIGLSTVSAVVRPTSSAGRGDTRPRSSVPGQWACRNASFVVVDCAAGPMRFASFTPDEPFPPTGTFYLDVNPEHVLDVTDLAGNPFQPRPPVAVPVGS